MNYSQVKNPIWSNAEHTAIDCEVDFDDLEENFVPFTANPLDTSNPASKEIYDQCIAGDYGTIGEYAPPQPIPPTAEGNKNNATKLLYETDWTTISDVADPALSNPYLMNQSDFYAYRSALRQIAVNPVAGNIDWPIQPTPIWSS
jgi:hypothetical protein